jgi:hypothetical protein
MNNEALMNEGPGSCEMTPAPLLNPTILSGYALNELPQPQVVLAWGFLIAKPDPCRLST